MFCKRFIPGTILLFFLLASLSSAQQQHFQPLQDTLTRFRIQNLPTAQDYPDVPAAAVLSFHEYRQLGMKHERRVHRIVKILSQAGKEYTTVRIPCFSRCDIRARTIKSDGTIINLPERDIIRTEKLTKYSTPYYFAHFAMPSVEPGDLIEYAAEVEYPYAFMLEDFRFAEQYPVWKGVFVLSHPQDDSYAYVLHKPPGTGKIEVSRDSFALMNNPFSRTTFVAEKVSPALEEPHAPNEKQNQPGMRIMIEARGGRRYESFKDWFHYGDLIAELAGAEAASTPDLRALVSQASDSSRMPEEIIRMIYNELETDVEITDDTLMSTSFEFQSPAETLKQKRAAPHDLALLLAVCFRILQWQSDLVLVNSHNQEDSSEHNVFPPDLDLVFLNVVADGAEFLLDCNQNGMPPFTVSSKAMNRFALGIPLFHTKTAIARTSNVYVTTMPYRNGNKSDMEINASPASDSWSIKFRWTLAGEYRAPFVVSYRQRKEEDFRRYLYRFLRSRVSAEELKDVQYRFLPGALEITGTALLFRKKAGNDLEILQNEFWNPGFDYRPYHLENRLSPLLLPVAGQISSSFRISPASGQWILPKPAKAECKPVTYSLTAQQDGNTVSLEEKIVIQDLKVKPPSFSRFRDFLNQYYANHYWTLLVENLP